MEQDHFQTLYLYGECTDGNSETFDLSDLDILMPATYVPLALVYELPPRVARSWVVETLKRGLKATLDQIPTLSGRIRAHPASGRLWVSKKDSDLVALVIKEVPVSSSIDLAGTGFPPSLLDSSTLFPPGSVGSFRPSNTTEELPVSVFQINFMAKHMILSFAFHHCCFDGTSYNNIMARWAQNSRPSSNQALAAAAAADETNVDRSRLMAKSLQLPYNTMQPDYKPDCFTCSKPDLPATDLGTIQRIEFRAVLYHFPQSSYENLRARASNSSMIPISTYVAIVSLLWMAVTRSRVSLRLTSKTSESKLANSVDVRPRMDPPLPNEYLGNAVALACTRLQLDTLLAPENFSQVAEMVQDSICDVDDTWVANLIAWSASVEKKTDIRVDLNAHLGWDFAVTSLQDTSYYSSADFGFGTPLAVRSLFTQRDGCAYVYPPSPTPDADQGFDVCVCLQSSCQDRLMLDAELLKYAVVKGP